MSAVRVHVFGGVCVMSVTVVVIIAMLLACMVIFFLSTQVKEGRKKQLSEVEVVIFGVIKWKMKIKYE